jgi:hypothetical protein
LLCALFVDVGTAIKATKFVVQDASEDNVNHRDARLKFFNEPDEKSLGFNIKAEWCGLTIDKYGLDVNLDRIENDETGSDQHINSDNGLTLEGGVT